MKLEQLVLDQTLGTILVHNIVGADGRKVFSKGHVIGAEDMLKLRQLGRDSLFVARLDADDVPEDAAAAQLAAIIANGSITASKSSGGRVNLYATQPGFLKVNRDALKRINELDGVTLATLARYSVVTPKKMIATLKTIGLALPQATIREVEKIVRTRGQVLNVTTVQNNQVAIILTGSENGRLRVQELLLPPIRTRIEKLGAHVIAEAYVDEDADALAVTLTGMLGAGAQLVVIAGETSIMDMTDITPQGIRRAGGEIESYGAPVEPGNLLLLAYCGNVPIIGAPGCVKSIERNIVDMILPPLLIGERVKRADVIEMAEGGLLHG